MPRYKTGLTKKIGQPPGSLLHTDQTRSVPQLTLINYSQDHAEERQITINELPDRQGSGIVWLHVKGAQHVPTIEAIGQMFSIHPLVLEDILTPGQRPKIEDYGEYTFLVLMSHTMAAGVHIREQISIVLGPDYVISFQDDFYDFFQPVRDRLLNAKGRMRSHGADYLAYAMIDMVVDHFFNVLECLGDLLESLEEDVVARPRTAVFQEIHEFKNQVLFLRKAVWPLRDMIGALERGQSPLFQESTLLYIRDVYDHSAQVLETLDMYREMISGLLDVYLSSLSNRMNEVIKMLTIISTMFMPLTFIVGLYGMNFKHMPELEWEWGYPLVLLLMVFLSAIMLWLFRRKRWI